MLNIFALSIIATILGIIGAWYYAGMKGVFVAAMLCILEISLSFDNAIVNASILKTMDKKWQDRFLTWGILIAVFGMRLVFPIALVAVATDLNMLEVMQLALNNKDQYAEYLTDAHVSIAAFGGMFLMMVFLGFILDHKREIHWLGALERRIGMLGNLQSIGVVIGLIILITLQAYLPETDRNTVMLSGTIGICTYVIIHSLTMFANSFYRQVANVGFMSFLYLEVLDASFSFDGVIGAFAITKDIVIIMIGLGVGAFFVRSITIFFVRTKLLQEYIYLEHGAHYALGALATMMLYSIVHHLSEIFVGSVGLFLIMLSYISSVIVRKRNRKLDNT